jgi:hypothetical protein
LTCPEAILFIIIRISNQSKMAGAYIK